MSPRAVIAFDCIFPAQTGGGERVYRAIAEELVEKGWDVEYLTREKPETITSNFRITSIWGGAIYDARGARLLTPALRFSSALFLALVKRRNRDLILVSATPVLNVFAARAALLLSRKSRLVIDWLEIWPHSKWLEYSGRLVGTLAWTAQGLALAATPHATANSRETITRMPRRLKKRNPTLLALSSLPRLTNPRLTKRNGAPVLLFVGRLIADKCVESIPGALAEVRKTYPTAELVIIGVGPERERIQTIAESLGFDSHTKFLGKVDDNTLDFWLRKATVLVNPSRREGFGLVVVEAASCGTPSVLVDGPENAAAQLIEKGLNGFVVRSHEPAEMAQAINLVILADDELRTSTFDWLTSRRSEELFTTAVEKLAANL